MTPTRTNTTVPKATATTGAVLQRSATRSAEVGAVPPIVYDVLREPGQPLDAGIREYFEPRFGADFGGVRVHTGSQSLSAAKSVNADAFTVGRDIVMGEPRSADSRTQLLAHELTHVVQQSHSGPFTGSALTIDPVPAAEHEAARMERLGGPQSAKVSVSHSVQRSGSPKYSDADKKAMREGTVQSDRSDADLAAKYGFMSGDIVFRKGSSVLAALIGEEVTHGGLYVGNGLLHDMVAFGNRTVRSTLFFSTEKGEAADPNVVKVVRFTGPLKELILPRVLGNIAKRDYWLPSDPKPWNLFSTADDYRTATCLEYVHAQFLYAIGQLSRDTSLSDAQRIQFRATYFKAGANTPSPLISPKQQVLRGDTGGMGGGGLGSTSSISSPSAILQAAALVAGANATADDVDSSVFENRDEGKYEVLSHGSFLADLVLPAGDQWTLSTYTFSSFKEATGYFTVVR
jgi:Domain of unknown function (DUF4157)